MRGEPWQTAEIPGPRKANVITSPKIISSLIRRASRPILLIGGEAAKDKIIDYALQLSEAIDMPIVVSPSILMEFKERSHPKVSSMSTVEIGERLRDPEWRGLDGSGPYDLALLMGFKYYIAWLILSGLKHFARRGEGYLTTINLDPYYQPHASWSLPNLPRGRWEENIKEVIEDLRR